MFKVGFTQPKTRYDVLSELGNINTIYISLNSVVIQKTIFFPDPELEYQKNVLSMFQPLFQDIARSADTIN